MFPGRNKLTSRDRDCGLVFQWRLPVGSRFRVMAAFALTALLTAGLAATVRVRAGGSVRQLERRGSLIMVPRGNEWRALEMMALEAGPMPVRADPWDDPAVRSLMEEALAGTDLPGYRYQPSFVPVKVELEEKAAAPASPPGLLPPLPEPEPPSSAPPLPDSLRPVLLGSDGMGIVLPEASAPPGLARGSRYLLAYDGSGRVVRVTALFTAKPGSDGSEPEAWLRSVKIEGGAKDGGWAAVEISSGS